VLRIHILSLFPESIKPYLETSIPKRAQEKGLFEYKVYNLTDWTVRNTRRVDDRPYGWLPGTIITIEPLTHALREIYSEYGTMKTYFMTPRGKTIHQETVEIISETIHECCIICGHYEWVDERIFSLFEIEQISIWNYVLSSWELSALVFIDSIVRLLDGVINPISLTEESFSKKLERKKEYPQYSRPEIFEGISVPKELLSGNKKKIDIWNQSHLGAGWETRD
jgi:tRNA (guanine37-N1)-methyltransferase